MTTTIDWLVTQSKIEGFYYIAGTRGSANLITGINIIDNPDTLPWLGKDEFILSTGYLLETPQLYSKLIKELVDKGCAGLGIKMKRYLDVLPREMLKQADELNFPIVGIPFDSNMAQISNLIYHQIFENEMSKTQRITLIYKEITESALKKNQLPRLLATISDTIKHPVFLTNDAFELMEYHIPLDCALKFPFPFSKDANTLFSTNDCNHIKNDFLKNHLPVLQHSITSSEKSYRFTIFPVIVGKTLTGYFVCFDNKRPLASDDYEFIDNIRPVLSILFINQSVLTEKQRSSRDIFFKEILSGSKTLASEIEPLCITHGFDFKSKRVCISMRLSGYEELSIAKRRAYERKVWNLIDERIDTFQVRHMKIVYDGYFVVFLFLKEGLIDVSNEHLGLKIAESFKKTLSTLSISLQAGISQCHYGSMTISTCYQESVNALELGEKLHSKKQIFLYQNDRIYHILSDNFTYDRLLSMYKEFLGPLEEYDQEYHAELLITLQQYLNCNQNITQTSKKLFIHRNTMFYRLEQIEKLLSIDLKNKDDLFLAQLGFYIKLLL